MVASKFRMLPLRSALGVETVKISPLFQSTKACQNNGEIYNNDVDEEFYDTIDIAQCMLH